MSGVKISTTGSPDMATVSNGSLIVTVPIKITRRGRRKAITLPDGTAMQPRAWDNQPTPLQSALARGYRWLELLESGKARNLTEVAEMEGMDRAYVSRIANLTTLAPDIVAAILDESLPDNITLFDLASGTPRLWDEQRALVQTAYTIQAVLCAEGADFSRLQT